MPEKKKNAQAVGRNYDKDVAELGHNIRNARERVGVSLDELARLINSDKSHLSKINNRNRNCSAPLTCPDDCRLARNCL